MIHNFGAAAVLGGSLLGFWPLKYESKVLQRLALIILIGWITQAFSGMSFGIISYIFYQKFPDIHFIAKTALYIKIFCTLAGIALTTFYFRHGQSLLEEKSRLVWKSISFMAIIAMSAAAVLRWFS